jgi:hypothetical protein
MTGSVALDLHFRAAQRNPPSIHRDAKHTLSVSGAALPGGERARRRSILYHDDLVRIVKLNVEEDPMPTSPDRRLPGLSRPGNRVLVTAR